MPNENVNKVVYGDTTVMDITDTTAEPLDVAAGEVFYTRSGARAVGTGNYMSKVLNPSAGDVLVTDANGQAQDSGTPLSSLALASSVPTSVSALTNDAGYQTLSDVEALTDGSATLSVASGGGQPTVYMRGISYTERLQFNDFDTDETGIVPMIATGNDGVSKTRNLATQVYVDNQCNDVKAYSTAYTDGQVASKVDDDTQATDSTLGLIKTNSDQAVTLDASGRLVVGGRMGQFPSTTGMYAPNNRDPRNVNNYSLLMTDAMGMDMSANRAMAVVSGYGMTCRSAAAGSTEYRIQNNYANRIIAILCAGGYASRDEATSTQQRVVQVVSITIGGSSYVPDSSANPSGTANDIVIKTAETLNPDGAITNIRLFGKMQSYATLHVGNGITSEGGGRNLLLGGGVTKAGSSNDNCLVGNGIYSSGNGNAAFGRYHILRKNRGFVAGTGHDTTNAPAEGASAVGQYSSIGSTTLFAIGNGTSHTARSNAFEVTSDGGIVLKSPNGTRYKILVDNNGNISTSVMS